MSITAGDRRPRRTVEYRVPIFSFLIVDISLPYSLFVFLAAFSVVWYPRTVTKLQRKQSRALLKNKTSGAEERAY